mgnify:CR=1 FL=1
MIASCVMMKRESAKAASCFLQIYLSGMYKVTKKLHGIYMLSQTPGILHTGLPSSLFSHSSIRGSAK